MKIIGLVGVWACEDFIRPCLEQAIEYCDEVLVCVSSYSKNLLKFEDKTLDIVKEYADKVKIVYNNQISYYTLVRADILNKMILSSDYFKVGNWLWILDADEFYSRRSYQTIKEVIQEDKYNQFLIEEKYFMINMNNYLLGNHHRLFKINSLSDRFVPTQKWTGSTKVGIINRKAVEMYHYGMLTNSHMKVEMWKTEYPNKVQNKKTLWINKIYKNYDLKNEDYWINKNYDLTKIYGPWFDINFKSNDYGKFFKHDGLHPEFIEDTNLLKIKDFREYFNFI